MTSLNFTKDNSFKLSSLNKICSALWFEEDQVNIFGFWARDTSQALSCRDKQVVLNSESIPLQSSCVDPQQVLWVGLLSTLQRCRLYSVIGCNTIAYANRNLKQIVWNIQIQHVLYQCVPGQPKQQLLSPPRLSGAGAYGKYANILQRFL